MASRAGCAGTLRLIALEQALAGGLGLLLVLAAPGAAPARLPGALALCLHAASLVAGLRLWRGSGRGVALSLLVQLLQLPALQLPFLVYHFWSGFGVGLVLDVAARTLRTRLLLGAEWRIEPQPAAPGPLLLGIDAVAALMATILWRELGRRRGRASVRRRGPARPPGTPGAPRPRRRRGSRR